MKKFIIVLMVVAVASFLFVGCLPGGVTPDPDPDPDPDPVVVATVAPIIVGVTDGAYVNKAEAVDGITVNGTAPTYSEVKIYINDICAGTGDTLANGTWTVVVAKADLGADGAKVLYATAKEAALDVSAKSNEKKFTLDTVYPKIKSVKARAGVAAVAGTATVTDGSAAPLLTVAPPAGVLAVVAANVEDGTWTLIAHGAGVMSITDPDGGISQYTALIGGEVFANNPIPGVTFTISAGAPAAPEWAEITCVASTVAVDGVVSLTFDEDLNFTGAVTNGNYTIWNNNTGYDILDLLVLGSTVFWTYNEATDTMFWRDVAGVGGDLAQGDFLTFQVDTANDLAGNPIPIATPETANTVVLASIIVIAP